MRAKANRWYVAIRAQLASGTRTTGQIWEGLKAVGFQHASVMPRSTLGARLAEMVADGALERVGPATYRLCEHVVGMAVEKSVVVEEVACALIEERSV
jgi:hypothetical protein